MCSMAINQTYFGGHLAIYTYTKSLCCKPDAITMLYVNYSAIKILRINVKYQGLLNASDQMI